MPTGKRLSPRSHRAGAGFTYLLLLFWLALAGAALAAAGTAWSTAAQRGREAELQFRGQQFSQALAAYRQATPRGQPDAPLTLDELLEDRRSGQVQRHLRRLWPDPYTGQADWVLLRRQGRIQAVHSRSQAVVFQAPPQAGSASQAVAADWVFGRLGGQAPSLPAAARSVTPAVTPAVTASPS